MTFKKRTLIAAGTALVALTMVVGAGSVLAGGHLSFTPNAHHPGMKAACLHYSISGLIQELELDEQQQTRLDAIHNLVEQQLGEAAGMHDQHLQDLVSRLSAGSLDAGVARSNIDLHIEGARDLAYAVADELITLVNSLDEEQMGTLINHLETAPCADHASQADRQHDAGHHGFGHR